MAVPVKVDIVYYNTASDFELEFNLNGCTPMRLLTAKPQDDNEFLKSMRLAVSRSQIIIVIGSLAPGMALDHVCNAIGYSCVEKDLSLLGCSESQSLPENAIPLVTTDGYYGGCVIECGPQSIIVLCDEREKRKQIMRDLVHQYVLEFGGVKKQAPTVIKEEKVEEKAEEASIEEHIEDVKEEDPYVLKEEKKEYDFSAIEEEMKNEPKEKKKRRALPAVIWALLFIAAGIAAYIFLARPALIDNFYQGYAELYGQDDGVDGGEISNDFDALLQENPDTVGYLKVGRVINLPIVSSLDKEEDYYKNHTFNGWYNFTYGTPYTDSSVEAEKYLRNTVIYGCTTDGKMFAPLKAITTLDGYRANPLISFDTLYRKGEYKIFAAFTTDEQLNESLLKTNFKDDDEFYEYIELLMNKTAVYTTVDVAKSDEIITLVAYEKNTATLVFARRVRINESSLVDTKGASDTTRPEAKPTPTQTAVALTDCPDAPFSNYSERALQYIRPNPYVAPSVDESSSSTTSSDTPQEEIKFLTVYNNASGTKETGSVSDIIAQIVAAEMGEDFEAEALKAQAVATYSWLLYNGAHEGNAPQVELKMASAEIIEAVNSVLGVCAYYDGKPAATYYHYCSAGNTASSQGVWGVSVPYLVSAPSSFDRNCEEYLNTNIYKASDIANWVRESAGIDLNKVTDRTKWFNVTYNGDYALSVRFGNDTQNFKAKYLREYIFTSERVGFSHALASQSYEITYRADNDTFVITTRGVGHGVGMSQYGANVLAKNGKNYKEILEHYYNGVVIK